VKGNNRHREAKTISYDLGDGWMAIVGKTDRDNDLLTFSSHANDLWLHVSGFAGSHVVIPLQEREEPPKDIIKKAASIAAWHSKAQKAGKVTVHCTQIKNVTKPRGAKAGSVQIRKEKGIVVRPSLPESR